MTICPIHNIEQCLYLNCLRADTDSQIGNLVWAFTDLTTKFESHLAINDVGKDNHNGLVHYKCAPKSNWRKPKGSN